MAKWIDTFVTIEIMAVNEQKTKEALKSYIERIKKEKYIKINNEIYSDVSKVENPRPNIKEAYWQSVELECSFETAKSLLHFTMSYGPSSVEVLGPKSLEIKMSELQEIVGSISEFMHRFAAQGVGGIVMTKK